jgi:hypothetical protein
MCKINNLESNFDKLESLLNTQNHYYDYDTQKYISIIRNLIQDLEAEQYKVCAYKIRLNQLINLSTRLLPTHPTKEGNETE